MAITGEIKTNTVSYADFEKYENEVVTIKGTIHNIRMMSDFAFVILRTARETIQCVYAESFSDYRMSEDVKEESATALCERIAELYPDRDVDVHRGGQPLYHYIISIE